MKLATSILVFCVGALIALGMVMLFSARVSQDGAHLLFMQLVWCGLGFVGFCVAMSVDYRHLKKISLPLLIFAAMLLLAVLVIGIRVNGAKRWLGYGSFRIQPSELAKLAVIIFLAHYADRFSRQMKDFVRGVVIPGAVVGAILLLIFFEPDVGTTMLVALVSSIMLLIAGLRWRYFLPPVVAGALAVGAFIYHDPMRSERIYSWLHLEETKNAKGHQAYQAMLALGSGGVTGLGLGNGRQKLGYVPEHHTDFILSVIGEELGLIATVAVMIGFIAIVACGVFISMRAPDTFGMVLGCGITFMIGVQAFINIGVVTGALPNKGMPLPFISYGGSNLLVMLCCVGLLLNVARHAVDRTPVFNKRGNPFREPRLQEAS